ncbi:MAG TPA: hypothetical protein VFF17_12030, partial [Thermoanaerobaculia bacterium]|nr:hypothetical protein [Thermoanaerobaculia bacterium]
IAISKLGADTDGDGLSDFLEEDLLTDPRDPDTDRDGIDDRADLLPNIRSGRASAESDAMASIVEYFVQWRRRTEIDQRRPPPPETIATRSWIESSVPRTFFFVADRRHFDSRSASARAMVLTPEEWKRVREKSGIPRAWMLTSFLLDRTRTRGVLRWWGASEWGALRLEKTDDGWRVESASHVVAGLSGPSGHRIRAAPPEET